MKESDVMGPAVALFALIFALVEYVNGLIGAFVPIFCAAAFVVSSGIVWNRRRNHDRSH